MFVEFKRARVILVCALHNALLVCSSSVLADGAQDLQISKAWLRATPPGSSVGAGYFTILNNSKRLLRIVGIQTALAKSAEIHQSFERDGHEQMRSVEGGLAISPGQAVALTPGGYHLMLIGLDHALVAGTSGPITLLLDDGSKLTTTIPVLTEWPAADGGELP